MWTTLAPFGSAPAGIFNGLQLFMQLSQLFLQRCCLRISHPENPIQHPQTTQIESGKGGRSTKQSNQLHPIKLQDSTCLPCLHVQQGLQSTIPLSNRSSSQKAIHFSNQWLSTKWSSKNPYPQAPPRESPSCFTKLPNVAVPPWALFPNVSRLPLVAPLHDATHLEGLEVFAHDDRPQGFGTNDFFGTNDWEYTRHIPSGTWGDPWELAYRPHKPGLKAISKRVCPKYEKTMRLPVRVGSVRICLPQPFVWKNWYRWTLKWKVWFGWTISDPFLNISNKLPLRGEPQSLSACFSWRMRSSVLAILSGTPLWGSYKENIS